MIKTIIKKSKLIIVGTIVLSLFSITSLKADCGIGRSIQLAEMNWLSARIITQIANTILTEGLGCQVEIVPGDTVPTGTSMYTKGKPDIAPEFWIGSADAIWEKMLKSGKVYAAGNIFQEGGGEYWFIPDYVAKANPGLKSYKDLPKYKNLFIEPSSNEKARLYGCPPGWACEIVNQNLFRALGLDDQGFELFGPGSGDNLKASIARKVAQKKPILAYYWTPTSVVGKYGLVALEMPPFNAKNFKCLSDVNCENPQPSSWKNAQVSVVASNEMKKSPSVARFLSKFGFKNKDILELLTWADDNKAEPEEAAAYFFKTNDTWTKWVSAVEARKIKASL